jgi:outer membrane lipoprotein-sorting protein
MRLPQMVFVLRTLPASWFVAAVLCLGGIGTLHAQDVAGTSTPAHSTSLTSSTLETRKALNSDETTRFLNDMATTLGGIRTLRVAFVQEREVPLFLDTLKAKGTCWFEAPDKIRWELTEPYVSILIHNTNKAAKFDKAEGGLRKMRPGAEDVLREVLAQIMSWIRGDFRAAREAYDLSVLQGSDYRLVLKPRTKGLAKIIEAIELTIDPKSLHVSAVTIREPEGGSIAIRFGKETLNAPMDKALFDLDHPKYPVE